MLKNLLSAIGERTVRFNIDWGVFAVLKLLSGFRFSSVLDVGSGEGEHKRLLEFFGKQVFSVDLVKDADYVGDFMDIDFGRSFDVIWCSHVLEHQRNVGLFLDKVFGLLEDGGIVAISVPLHPRERLISGHLTSWSIPLLCYNLVMAGFDCSEAAILSTFELSLLVRKRPAEFEELRKNSAHGADAGVEFAAIERFFPFPAKQGAEVPLQAAINWGNPTDYVLPAPERHAKTKIEIISKAFRQRPELAPKIRLGAAPLVPQST